MDNRDNVLYKKGNEKYQNLKVHSHSLFSMSHSKKEQILERMMH